MTRLARSAWSPVGWPSERPAGDPEVLEAFCYTDRFSYTAGDTVDLHVHTTADQYTIEVVRDGREPLTVLTRAGLPGLASHTPANAYAQGCGWPVGTSFVIGDDWPTGFYLVVIRVERDDEIVEREHFLVVKEAKPSAPYVLVLSTATLLAYNDWGGANSYRGLGDDPYIDEATPHQSTQRPIARGMLRKPPGAPRTRVEAERVPPGWHPRYECYEWARLNGYNRHHADAFWATYEREFVLWAEAEGYELAYLTQHDLHFDPHALDGYACAVFVGHDEYYSWEMRDAIDNFVDQGGNVARFGGNFIWQVRYEDDGRTQVCFKVDFENDPVIGTPDERRLSTYWDHPLVDRPGAQTMGTTGLGGVYHRYGAAAPRGAGGFTVYRPEHWSFADSDLYYGDILGGRPAYIAAFEVDGLDYTFRDGQPFATGTDGAATDIEILAMVPALRFEEDRFDCRIPLGDPGLGKLVPELDGTYYVTQTDGSTRPVYGCGAIVCFERGAGTVYNTGASEWVAGLLHRDWFVEQVTRTVLGRLGAAGSRSSSP